MSFSVVQGFTKSLAMTVLSEIGDKTFFAAAVYEDQNHGIPSRGVNCFKGYEALVKLDTLDQFANLERG